MFSGGNVQRVMPASSAEVIGAALQSAFQHKPADTAPSSLHKKNHIEDQLVASSKQVRVLYRSFRTNPGITS